MTDKTKFFKDVTAIYPEGDLERGYDLLMEIQSQNKEDSLGNSITYDYILSKFRDFHHSWNLKYGKQLTKGFLSKEAEAERKNIYQFLLQASYLREYQTSLVNVERDKYLFGNQPDKLYDGIKRIEQELLAKR